MATINKTEEHFNRGVEFILNGGKKKQHKPITKGGKKVTIESDLALLLVLPVSFLIFLVGLLMGWVARDYMMNYREIPRPHPEMFDGNGNLVADEVIAFKFENYHDDNETEEDDD